MGRASRRVLLVALAWVLSLTALAGAEPEYPGFDVAEILRQQIDTLPTQDIESFLASLDPRVREQLPAWDLRSLADDPTGALRWDVWGILEWLSDQLVREIVVGSRLLLQLILLAMAGALLKSLASSLGGEDVTDIAFLITLMALVLLGLDAFGAVVRVAGGAIDEMVTFMNAVLPLLTTLLVAVGGATSATLFHPLLVSLVFTIGVVVKSLLVPLAYSGVVLGLLGKFSDEAPLGRLSGMIRQANKTVLGLLFVLFMGVISIRGAIGPVIDGLGVRTAKFLTGTFVPVIGGRLAEAMDVVIGGSLLIKNAVGAFGLLVVLLVTALPTLKIFSLLLIFRVATVCIEPISEERLASALSGLGDGVAVILSCVLTVALMFFLAVTVLVALGNLTVVMR